METSAARHYRADVDGLRGVAVLAVVLFHAEPAWLPGGYRGVDLFFVVSGFLITGIVARALRDGTFSLADFYARRIRRLFPALLVVLAAVLAIGHVALFNVEYQQLGVHAAYSIVFMLDFRLMQEAGYFDVASHAKPLLHLWSLAVEEQFYLLWPLLLLGLHRLRLPFLPVALLLTVGSLGFAVHAWMHAPDAAFFHPLARFWEIGAGAALGLVMLRAGAAGSARGIRHAVSIAGLGAILAALAWPRVDVWTQLVLAVLSVAGAVMLIWAGPKAFANRLLQVRALVFVGLISYPLYLWHWPLMSFVRIAESGYPSSVLIWSTAVVSVLLAWLTYAMIERPLRFGLARRRAVPFTTACMASLLLAALVIVDTAGLGARAAVRHVEDSEPLFRREPRQDAACLARFPAGGAPVYCREARGGDQVIAVVGDSHAHVLFPGVAELAMKQAYGALLLANSGCPPFDGALFGRTDAERARCAADIERILDAVERVPEIVAVVLASRGPQYIDGTGFGAIEANYNFPPLFLHNGSEPDGHDAFSRGLAGTVARLHARGLQVAYLLQVPELGVTARDCLPRPLVLTQPYGCRVDYTTYAARMAPYRDLVAGVQAAHPALAVVDAERVFCDETQCNGLQDGDVLYTDDNHLSVSGSRLVAPLIIEALGVGGSATDIVAGDAVGGRR